MMPSPSGHYTPTLHLPLRAPQSLTVGERLWAHAAAILSIRNVSATVLAASSAVVLWTTIETAAALAERAGEDKPETAITAGIVLGAAGGAVSATLAAFALHISRVVSCGTAAPIAFACSAGSGMVVGTLAGGLSAYSRWTEVREAVLTGSNSASEPPPVFGMNDTSAFTLPTADVRTESIRLS